MRKKKLTLSKETLCRSTTPRNDVQVFGGTGYPTLAPRCTFRPTEDCPYTYGDTCQIC